jgi:tetratricopeptide (TPR) repeat protein
MIERQFRTRLACLSAAIAIAVLSPSAMAQIFEDVSVVQHQTDATRITVQFNAKVRFKRAVVSSTNDLVTIYFEIAGLTGDGRSVFEESRKWSDSDLSPAFQMRYFSEANQPTEKRLEISFKSPVQGVQAGPGVDEQSFVLTMKRPVAAAIKPPVGRDERSAPPAGMPPATVITTPLSESDQAQAQLLATARDAAQREDYETAIAELNKLLNMPPGAFSQDGQELIGFARERLKETKRAQAEYELYLKLYPDGAGAARVKLRLAALSIVETEQVATADKPRVRKPVTSTWGGISQYYYGGKSKIRDEFTTTDPISGATQIDTQSLSTTDQSSIVTDVNYNLRHRRGAWDTRVTLRDTFRHSFIEDQPSRNRLSSAYIDLKHETTRFATRVGRQTATSGGVLGRFDGAVASIGLGTDKVRGGVEVGKLIEPGLGGDKRFYGATMDADHIFDKIGLGFFGIQQNASGDLDRRAVGGEFRYFADNRSVFGLVDYDVFFKKLNVASVQGNFGWGRKFSVNFLYDYRRSPSLQMTNALLGQPETNLQQLSQTLTQEQIKEQAIGLTPVARSSSLGVTMTLSPKWQMSADYRLSSVSGTIATATLPASDPTGDIKTLSAQVIGTGIFAPSDVFIVNTNYLTSRAYNAWLLGLSTRVKVGEAWVIEPGIKYYLQDNAAGSTSRRLSPVGRFAYRRSEHLSFEAEFNLERTRTEADTSSEDLLSLFYYLGYRYDF